MKRLQCHPVSAEAVDGPKPNRMPMTKIRNPLDENPTEGAETTAGVLDERKQILSLRAL